MAIRTDLYPDDLIRAINDWQAGSKDKERKTRKLREASRQLPARYREAPEVVYRQVRANAELAVGVAMDAIPDEVSSWTTSKDIAQRFREHDLDREKVLMIFARHPTRDDIILNLNAIYADAEFMVTVEAAEARLNRQFSAIRKWKGSQQEVVLEETVVGNDEIVALGAFRRLDDAVPMIGDRDPSAPSDDEIFLKLTGRRTDEHFWVPPDSAGDGVRNAAEKIRACLAKMRL